MPTAPTSYIILLPRKESKEWQNKMHKSPKSNKRRDTLKYVGLDSKNKSNSYSNGNKIK